MQKKMLCTVWYFTALLIMVLAMLLPAASQAQSSVPFFSSTFESLAEIKRFRVDKIEKHAFSTGELAGVKAVKITIDTGYKLANNTERSELQDPLKIPFNQEVWYRVDVKIPLDFPEVDSRVALWQIKQAGKNNPVLAMYYRAGKISLKQTFTGSKVKYYQPDVNYKGKWLRFVVHSKVSHSSSGFFNVYLDNEQIIAYQGQTAHHNEKERNSYFKFGVYRDVTKQPMHTYFKQFTRGRSWLEVVPEEAHEQPLQNLWRVKVK